MEKDRSSKLLAIIALVVAVCGLSFGFAAFTKDLNITFSESNVKVNGDLDVVFYAGEDGLIEPYHVSVGAEATPFTISDDYTTISGGSVTFTGVSQSVIYQIVGINNSEYDAYLKDVEFLDYGETGEFKVCTALPGTSQDLVDEACEGIYILLSSGEGEGSILFDSTTVDEIDFSSIFIPSGIEFVCNLTIYYNVNSVVPNGDFKINFGGIKFDFSSLEG